MYKIAFDIGGVLSKYPDFFRTLLPILEGGGIEIHVITDMHDREETLKMLRDNKFSIPEARVHNADYKQHVEACKAIILRDLQIDAIVDDFPGYLVWPFEGEAPIRLHVQPDPYRPYWDNSWECSGGDFGRRKYMPEKEVRTAFVSGHLDITKEEFADNYVPTLQQALNDGCTFVVGDARGADTYGQVWLNLHKANVVVYHMFTTPRTTVGFPLKGGFEDDLSRDQAMTKDSDFDIAWVRPGRESSGTAENLKRRNDEDRTHSNK